MFNLDYGLKNRLQAFLDRILGKEKALNENTIENLMERAPKKKIVQNLKDKYIQEMGINGLAGLSFESPFTVDISDLDERDRFIMAVIDYSQFFGNNLSIKNVKREVISDEVRYRISAQQVNADGFEIFIEFWPGKPDSLMIFFETDRFIYESGEEWAEFRRFLNRTRFSPKEFEKEISQAEDENEIGESIFSETKSDFIKDRDFKYDVLSTRRVLGDYDYDPKDLGADFTDYLIDREVQFKSEVVVMNKRSNSEEHRFNEFVRYDIYNDAAFASLYIGYELPMSKLKFIEGS
ncbi:hypothetical protein ACTG16_21900 [Aeromonas sp. 23P]|uniref:hypothetical protein n=1 Tax=Aeromonas sp. 23P TaxID=3452716 RepID=UPI003F7948DE